MSKTQLKKLLSQLSAEQISEMVLELYDARPEAKEYLDFFVSPDVDKKLEKTKSLIRKEASRTSRGRSKARVTKIRRYIKDIVSLNPGSEAVAEIMTFAVETMCAVSNEQLMKTATQGGTSRLLRETVLFCDAAGLLSDYLQRVERAVESMESKWWKGNEFKKLMKQELKDTVQSL